jgi:hypothetical protein
MHFECSSSGEERSKTQGKPHPIFRVQISREVLKLATYNARYEVRTASDSLVGIANSLRAGSRVRFPLGTGKFFLHHSAQNRSGAHPASYPMVTGGSFAGGKAAGV